MLTMKSWFGTHKVTISLDRYANNGNLYLGLTCYDDGYPEPYSDLTVNLHNLSKPNLAYIDTNNNGEGIIEFLVENKLGHVTGNVFRSGYCIYPEFEFDMKEVEKHTKLTEEEEEELMEKCNHYEEDKFYSPSNPWDAPGMKVSDFI